MEYKAVFTEETMIRKDMFFFLWIFGNPCFWKVWVTGEQGKIGLFCYVSVLLPFFYC